ncbi:Rieske 2Fe-2S domain-containing protein [Aerosakkonema funiforme]|uniref:aromatic ring-hydroxylating dioxygenase subunit alpha n=1 Tax=Aerosakkonema funiforme TaxID=1246630 RepID=UPI0035B6C8EB
MSKDLVSGNDWYVVATVTELLSQQMVRKHLLGEDLVIWCNGGDRFMAWSNYCPHRGVRLSMGQISGESLVCPYHGLVFNCAGECVQIPSDSKQKPPGRMRVQTYQCAVRYGLVWVCLGARQGEETEHQIPPFPEWDDPSYRKVLWGPRLYRASGLRVIENFLDPGHAMFVHDGILGDRAHPEVSNYTVEIDSDGISIRNAQLWQPNPEGTNSSGFVTYNYRVWRPLTLSLFKETVVGKLTLFITITPVAEDECLVWVWLAMNYGYELSEEELLAFQDLVGKQDIDMIESQRPSRLPLDLRAEVHLRNDRASIAYRKWLKHLGVTFGTI